MSKLTVCLAESAGFCFGVERAVDTVYEVLQEEREKEEKERLPIYTYGEIVHNEKIVEDLESRGVTVLKDLDELRNLQKGIVVIRAHGVGKEIYDILKARTPYCRQFLSLCTEDSETGAGT